MQRRSFSIATWLLLTAPAATAQDAAPGITVETLVSKWLAAEIENEKRAAQYVYDERIVHWTVAPDGRRRRDRVDDYEVMSLEGFPYYRLVRRNGQPLTPAEVKAEKDRMDRAIAERRAESGRRQGPSERRRVGIPFREIPARHRVEILGEDSLDEVPVVVLSSRPLLLSDSSTIDSVQVKMWIDPITGLRIRTEVEYLLPFGSQPIGTTITYRTRTMPDGTVLTASIQNRRPNRIAGKAAGWITEQEYSNYRKFEAISTVRPD